MCAICHIVAKFIGLTCVFIIMNFIVAGFYYRSKKDFSEEPYLSRRRHISRLIRRTLHAERVCIHEV